jgi:predicted enzyme related to lactoylglutathione lyase
LTQSQMKRVTGIGGIFSYIVEDLKALLKTLREEGVQVVGEIEEYDYGNFSWIMDPEGNKIELWEPVDQ